MIRSKNNDKTIQSYLSKIEKLPCLIYIEEALRNKFNLNDSYILHSFESFLFVLIGREGNKNYEFEFLLPTSEFKLKTTFYFDDFNILKTDGIKNYIKKQKKEIIKFNEILNLKENIAPYSEISSTTLEVCTNKLILQKIRERTILLEYHDRHNFHGLNDKNTSMTSSCDIEIKTKITNDLFHCFFKEILIQAYAKKDFNEFISDSDLSLFLKLIPDVTRFCSDDIFNEHFPHRKIWLKNIEILKIKNTKINKETKEIIELNFTL